MPAKRHLGAAPSVVVDESIADPFLERLLDAVRGIRSGPQRTPRPSCAGVVTESEARRVESMVAETVQAGASLLLGGERDGDRVSPTVVDHVRPGMPLFDRGLFGPADGVIRAGSLWNRSAWRMPARMA